MNRISRIAGAIALTLVLGVAGVAPEAFAQQEPPETGFQPPPGQPSWLKQGETYWREIEETLGSCPAGRTQQSPRNLLTNSLQTDPSLKPLVFDYHGYPLYDLNPPPINCDAAGWCTHRLLPGPGLESFLNFDLVNNGHTLQLVLDPDYYRAKPNYRRTVPPERGIIIDDRRFKLVQLHFHVPSEHLIDGRRYAMEMHLVHKAEAALADRRQCTPGPSPTCWSVAKVARRQQAVVAVLFDIARQGTSPDFAIPSLEHLRVTGRKMLDFRRDLVRLNSWMPQNKSYIRYDGSLTTPPCTEDVIWHVLTTPRTVSAWEVEVFRKIAINVNARPYLGLQNVGPFRTLSVR